ncbi:MAG TPA: L-seryl-tRNA(Sec) selenium transferase [Thermoanaerobaculia bacterium]
MSRPSARPPSIDRLLGRATDQGLVARYGRERVKTELRAVAEAFRSRAAAPGDDGEDGADGADATTALTERLVTAAAARLESRRLPGPVRVVNATGVLLHTNLGRAPLAEAARAAVIRSSGFSTLELDLTTGGRGRRGEHVRPLLLELFGAGRPGLDALAVTNAAAALLLILDTVANGQPVVVSRGELVAIGGDFRVPSILAKSGATLLEVGTTNKTTEDDYREALEGGARAVLKVHPSNYRIVGFTEEVPIEALSKLTREHSVPLVFDAGSGAPGPLPELALRQDELPSGALDAGADIVCFSGDKLLGGPQAGILLGDAETIGRAARNPLARALRLDKLALAALAATVDLHLSGRRGEIPLYRMLSADLDGLSRRAEAIARGAAEAGLSCVVVETEAVAGAGSGAESTIPSRAVAVSGSASAERLAALLRAGKLPVLGRIEAGRLLLDLRTVAPEEDAELLDALRNAVRSSDP